jgi:hypothetical protein
VGLTYPDLKNEINLGSNKHGNSARLHAKDFRNSRILYSPVVTIKIDSQIETWCLHPIATRALARWQQAGRKKGVKRFTVEFKRVILYTGRPFRSSEVALFKSSGVSFSSSFSPSLSFHIP